MFVEEGSVSRSHVTHAVQITAQSSQSEAKDRMVGTLDEAPVDEAEISLLTHVIMSWRMDWARNSMQLL